MTLHEPMGLLTKKTKGEVFYCAPFNTILLTQIFYFFLLYFFKFIVFLTLGLSMIELCIFFLIYFFEITLDPNCETNKLIRLTQVFFFN